MNRLVRLSFVGCVTLRMAMSTAMAYDKRASEENAGVGQGFTGAQRCGQCHAFAYQVWQQSAHARAHLSLTAAQLGDSRCRSCHTVNSTWVGVQCESCHGPGKYYQADYVMRDRELSRAVGLVETQPSHCQQCHTAGSPSLVAFDFKSMWAAIDHSRKLAEQTVRSLNITKAFGPMERSYGCTIYYVSCQLRRFAGAWPA